MRARHPRHLNRGLTSLLVVAVTFTACKQEAPEPQPAEAPAPAPIREEPRPPSPDPIVPMGAPTSFAPLVERVKGAVVNVDVQVRRGGNRRRPMSPYERFFGPQPPQVEQSAGSGFIVDADGKVMTNNHVIEGAAAIRVRLDDGRSFAAEVVGRDPLTDLALLQLEGVKDPLPTVQFGDSRALNVGDWVVAVGNPFGLASSVSAGILSARSRDIQSGPYDDFLQTDAAINPGNSGGPLFNLAGEVIGINTAIVGGASGIGFAVPSNMARELMPQLEQGVVRRGWIGVSMTDVTSPIAKALGIERNDGALVAEVGEGSPGEAAGLKAKDVVIALDGQPLRDARMLTQRIGLMPPGRTVTLTIEREGETRELQVELGERPDFEGIGIPARNADPLAQLGLSFEDAAPRAAGRRIPGAIITEVEPDSPAAYADLRPGMLIIEAGGRRVQSAEALRQVLQSARSGQMVLLVVASGRGGAIRALEIP
jgi:serine protease Do